MAELSNLLNATARSEWIRVRTLVLLRWMAIVGQTIAVVLAVVVLNIELSIGFCAIAIGASIVFNMVTTFVLPENKRLSVRNAILSLLFDLFQLSFLLFLTGGLNNPFALLILAPVTISATALTFGAMLLLSATAIALITLLAFVHAPLVTTSGLILYLPPIFLLGVWVSLVIGIVFLGIYARRVTAETFGMSQALTATQMALEREHKLTVLGGVVAAAAHELGTPLATIKLVAAELKEELHDRPDLLDDVVLIHEQATRCHAILKDMGRSGKDDLHLKHTTLPSLIREAAEPHENRGKQIIFLINGLPEDEFIGSIPYVARTSEIIHGLRNLVQNAVDFATARVWINIIWSDTSIRVLVGDDGNGYPPELLGRIGDPFLGKRKHKKKDTTRPEYEGMGLGLFIAKTLLERSGAELTFANAAAVAYGDINAHHSMTQVPHATGAIVNVRWTRGEFEKPKAEVLGALGLNEKIQA